MVAYVVVEGKPYHDACARLIDQPESFKQERYENVCNVCDKVIPDGDEVISAKGMKICAPCFKCTQCSKPINGGFIARGDFFRKEGHFYHPECAKK